MINPELDGAVHAVSPRGSGHSAHTAAADPVPFGYITDPARAAAAIALLGRFPLLGVDTETMPRSGFEGRHGAALDPYLGRPRLLQACTQGGHVFVFDLLRLPIELLQPLARCTWVGHNVVFDLMMLASAGLPMPSRIEDTLLAARALSGSAVRYSLQDLVRKVLDEKLAKDSQTSDWSAPVLSPEQLQYAAADALATMRTFLQLQPELVGPQGRFYRLLCDVTPVIARQQLVGVPFDFDRCRELAQEHRTQAAALHEQLHTWHRQHYPGRPPLNVNSPKQIGELLQAHLPPELLAVWPKTDSGKLSTAADELALLDGDALGELAKLLGGTKRPSRIASTLEGYLQRRHPVTDRLHPQYIVAGAVSGRFGCRNPNLQNPPRDRAVRALVRAPAGYTLVQCDLSAIELRVLAVLAPENRLRKVLACGEDVHRNTAALMLNKPTDRITKEERSRAKAVIFGSMYGQGHAGLVRYARKSYGVQLTVEQAAQLQDRLWRAYPGMRQWQQHRRAVVTEEFEIATRCGNVRRFHASEWAGNAVLAHEVSGSAAEVLLYALIRLAPMLERCGGRLIHHVHDEVLILVSEQQAAEALSALRESLEEGWLAVFPEAPDLLSGLAEPFVTPHWSKN